MAIDTAFKRKNASAARKLPWQRRFLPTIDGTIGGADRSQLNWSYLVHVSGPFCTVASQSHVPGSIASQSHVPGSVSAQSC